MSVRDQTGSRFLHSSCTLCVEEERAQDRALIRIIGQPFYFRSFILAACLLGSRKLETQTSLVSEFAVGA